MISAFYQVIALDFSKINMILVYNFSNDENHILIKAEADILFGTI